MMQLPHWIWSSLSVAQTAAPGDASSVPALAGSSGTAMVGAGLSLFLATVVTLQQAGFLPVKKKEPETPKPSASTPEPGAPKPEPEPSKSDQSMTRIESRLDGVETRLGQMERSGDRQSAQQADIKVMLDSIMDRERADTALLARMEGRSADWGERLSRIEAALAGRT